MTVGLIVFLVFGYAIGACLMMALWSRIPPRRVLVEFSVSIIWPLYLIVMILAALASATIRAISDQDGQFAGIYKDSEWYRMNKKKL